ncbi:MAG TPA: vitamin K epoxide reductase family protein [Acidimicrobiales bacterium]|nr:vitamin K epoxide reductase family protein [Acidimicrobiales bacterium]
MPRSRALSGPEDDAGDDVVDEDGGLVVPSWRPVTVFLLAVAAFGVSMYLTVDHFSGVLPYCSSKGFIDCQAVTTSKYSYLFHVPVALLGLIFYTVSVAANWPPLWRVRSRVLVWGRLALAVGGIGFVLYLVGAELLSIKAICIWCTSVHVISFAIFVIVVMSFPAMQASLQPWDEWEGDDGDDEGGDGGAPAVRARLEAEDLPAL